MMSIKKNTAVCINLKNNFIYHSSASKCLMLLLSVLFCASVYAAPSSEVTYKDYQPDLKKNFFENIEWNMFFEPSDKKQELPNVLLIGDSIFNGCWRRIVSKLNNVANVSYYYTSKCVSGRDFFRCCEIMFNSADYDCIIYQNAAHALGSPAEQRDFAYRQSLRYFKAKCPNAKIIAASGTPYRIKTFTSKMQLFNERTKVIAKAEAVTFLDLFSPLVNLDRKIYWSDNVHLSAKGYEIIAEKIADEIKKSISNVYTANDRYVKKTGYTADNLSFNMNNTENKRILFVFVNANSGVKHTVFRLRRLRTMRNLSFYKTTAGFIDDSFREQLSYMLDENKYELIVVNCGPENIEKYTSEQYKTGLKNTIRQIKTAQPNAKLMIVNMAKNNIADQKKWNDVIADCSKDEKIGPSPDISNVKDSTTTHTGVIIDFIKRNIVSTEQKIKQESNELGPNGAIR